jgi:transcriptional regulator GlxA family with amidase domain
MLAKLAELMFVDALRRYIESMPPGGKGWLAGVRDAQVGRALALLHAKLDRPRTVDELAREVALSRSGFRPTTAWFVGLHGSPRHIAFISRRA